MPTGGKKLIESDCSLGLGLKGDKEVREREEREEKRSFLRQRVRAVPPRNSPICLSCDKIYAFPKKQTDGKYDTRVEIDKCGFLSFPFLFSFSFSLNLQLERKAEPPSILTLSSLTLPR